MKKYSEFCLAINEASGKNYIDVFDEGSKDEFDESGEPIPVERIHRDDIVEAAKDYLEAVQNGYYKSVKVFADVPTYGKNRPAYLEDVLPVVKRERTPDDRPIDDEPDDINIFVDVEFDLIGVDEVNNKIIGSPVSLKKRGITTPIDPKYVVEFSYIRNRPVAPVPDLPFKIKKQKNLARIKDGYVPGYKEEKAKPGDEEKYVPPVKRKIRTYSKD